MAGAKGLKQTDQSVQVFGLAELQRALKATGQEASKATRAALRGIARPVQRRAQGNAPVDSGKLRGSIRIGVTTKSVSVYSNKPYAAVQDLGGRIGKGAVIQRADASHYMTNAYRDSKPDTEQALRELSDRIADEYERG